MEKMVCPRRRQVTIHLKRECYYVLLRFCASHGFDVASYLESVAVNLAMQISCLELSGSLDEEVQADD